HAKLTGQTVVAGGAESPSTAWPDGHRTQAAFTPQGFADPDMTTAADQLAAEFGLTRAEQEAYAAQSHQRGLDHPSEFIIGRHRDDGPRNVQRLLGRLAPVTNDQTATVTGLAAARIADAAAAIQLAPATGTRDIGVEILDYRMVGADPARPGLAAAPAIAVLATIEAYAAQPLAVCQQLGLDPAKINARGGALAHGPPWAASGTIGLLTTIEQLSTAPTGTLGVTGAAIAGGMGVAVL